MLLENKLWYEQSCDRNRCNNQKIYDCEETHALTLTKSNISLCCGENSGGVKEVSLCFIIDERPKKKNK